MKTGSASPSTSTQSIEMAGRVSILSIMGTLDYAALTLKGDAMVRNVLLGSMLAAVGSLACWVAAPASYVYVQVGPPAAVVETVPARPGAGYVWMGGYWTWNGSRYVWVHGRYVRHGGAWCAGALAARATPRLVLGSRSLVLIGGVDVEEGSPIGRCYGLSDESGIAVKTS